MTARCTKDGSMQIIKRLCKAPSLEFTGFKKTISTFVSITCKTYFILGYEETSL